MARLIPNDLTPQAFAGGHSGELATLDLLRRGLPDDYSVFHSIHWALAYERSTAFGEVDFVIVNGDGEILLIEQKNGRLQETESTLIKDYGSSQKNVGDQLHRSIDHIRDKFKLQNPSGERLSIDYLVYCPEHRITRLNSAALDRNRIVDAGARVGLVERIQQLLKPGGGSIATRFQAERVHEFFTRTFDLLPDVHAHRRAQERAYTRLSGGLIGLIDNLEMTPFRLRIRAVAGAGKTQLARHFYDRCLAAGKRPLLICFNRPLRDSLAATVGEGGRVETWYSLLHHFLESRGHRLNFNYGSDGAQFWRQVEELVLAAPVDEQWKFDAVIIDEAQDFEPEWHELLALFQNENADLLWLEDPAQNILARQDSGVEAMVTYNARDNYRTPHSIARFIGKVLPEFSFEARNDTPGFGVKVRGYSDPEAQRRLVDKAVKALLQQGFEPEDIVLLTCRGIGGSALSDVGEVAGLPLRRFTGDYDSAGNQLWSEGRVTFESVYRFKGQQAPAVVLLDVDPRGSDEARERRLLFTGMTRATVRLELLVRETNARNRDLLSLE